MPIYEYRCASCGAELEKLQKISDPPLVECPECGKDALTKLVSASSFRLKGSGWYETDFKTGKKKNGAGDSDAAAPDSASAGGAGSDKGTSEAGKQAGKDSAKESGKESKTANTNAGAEAGKSAGKGKEGAGATGKPAPKE